MKPILVISFRRSGTHFLLETLKTNFEYNLIDNAFHPGFDLHCSAFLRKKYNTIYIYRNPREVIKSLYNFFRTSIWRVYSGFDADLSGVSFADFLRGKTKIINVFCPHFRLIFENPILAWVEHTKWMFPLNKFDIQGKIFSIRYEDLVDTPKREITRISQYLKAPLIHGIPKPFVHRVALNKNPISVEFTKEDEDLLFKIAGNRMRELGYE
jgi:hypothetical protein